MAISVSIVTMLCFYIAGTLSSTSRIKGEALLNEKEKPDEIGGWRGILSITTELLKASDFQRIVITNFIHTTRSVAHLNFASIATDLLIPQSVLAKGSWQISAFFAACTLIPQILVITNERLLVRTGVYRIMMFAFMMSIISSGMYLLSWSPLVLIFFMLADSILVHSISPLFNILLAEFIEEDTQRNSRR